MMRCHLKCRRRSPVARGLLLGAADRQPARAELHDRHHAGQRRAAADRRDRLRRPGRGRRLGARTSPAVIAADLERSGLFTPIDQRAFIQSAAGHRRRAALRRLARDQRPGAGHRRGRPQADGRLRGRVPAVGRLRRAADGRPRLSRRHAENWRRIAHIIADAIYKRLTGEDGYFDTRIVYIAESGPPNRAHQAARDHGPGRRQPPVPDRRRHLVLTPRFSPIGAGNHLSVLRQRHAARLSLQHRHRTAGGARRFPGHDLRAALLARRQQGDHVAWRRTATPTSTSWTCATRRVERLTNDPAIDTSPSYSPDGSRIVFNSDRGGTPAALRDERRRQRTCSASASARAATRPRCGRRAAT